jgi:hypothetical protein
MTRGLTSAAVAMEAQYGVSLSRAGNVNARQGISSGEVAELSIMFPLDRFFFSDFEGRLWSRTNSRGRGV